MDATLTNTDRLSKIITELDTMHAQEPAVARVTHRNGSYGLVANRTAALTLGREMLRAASEPAGRRPLTGLFSSTSDSIEIEHADEVPAKSKARSGVVTFTIAFLTTTVVCGFAMLGFTTASDYALEHYMAAPAEYKLPASGFEMNRAVAISAQSQAELAADVAE